MIKTLKNTFKQDKEKFAIPSSVQQAIPIQAIWQEGIFQVGRNKFSKTALSEGKKDGKETICYKRTVR